LIKVPKVPFARPDLDVDPRFHLTSIDKLIVDA
jgi:hypothetical protein